MSKIQKVIKYCALVLAIFIIFSIVTGVIGSLTILANIFGEDTVVIDSVYDLNVNTNIKKINIDLNSSKLIIK